MIKANNPALKSWVNVPKDSDFPIQNLPFGIFKTKSLTPRVGIAIGENIVDLYALSQKGFLKQLDIDIEVFNQSTLNAFIALGKPLTRALRDRISHLLSTDCDDLKNDATNVLIAQADATMLLPVKIGDYTDFYSSLDHATNVGTMFRGKENALMPNWKHMPVGYHGRSSSIVVSGTNIHRPKGQLKPEDASPIYGASKLFDFELETGFVIGKSTELGESVSTKDAEEYIFGMALFNDLSARDIQKWEYVPLGPFLGKNFGSILSPWIVTLDALEPFRVEGYNQEPEVLDYLKYEGKKNYDIQLEVQIQPENGKPTTVCKSNFKFMYWNMCQQLAHQTVNGCNINVGDFYASGTISGPSENSFGSMLELSWRGSKPIKMNDGSERKFLQDGDTCIVKGYNTTNDGIRIGFGECITKVLPAK